MAVTPGPKEFTSEQLQYVMKELVDDLIKLYEEGIVIETPLYPAGKLDVQTRLICVVL